MTMHSYLSIFRVGDVTQKLPSSLVQCFVMVDVVIIRTNYRFFKLKAGEFSSFVINFSNRFQSKTMPMTLVVPMVVKAMILHSVCVVVGALSGHTC